MPDKYSLKRGEGLSCSDKAWDLPTSNWIYWPTYVPNGYESFLGLKKFKGLEFGVFQCMDDSFYAQPVEILQQATPRDPMKVVSLLPKEYKAMSETNDSASVDVLKFKGKNWKLAGDKKWKPFSVPIEIVKDGSLGSRSIKGKEHKIFAFAEGFIALPS
jgi:hypothetical protein